MKSDFLANISAEKVSQHIQYLSENIGLRVGGTPEELNAAIYMKRNFESLGLPTEMEETEVFLDRPVTSRLKLIRPEEREIECESFAWSGSTAGNGTKAPLIFVGHGTRDEYAGKQAAGKIVLAWVGKIWRGEKLMIAQEERAKGLVMMTDMPGWYIGNLGSVSYHSGSLGDEKLLPKIPAVNTPYEEGQKLLKYAQEGKAEVWLRVKRAREWRDTYNLTATLEGSKWKDEIVYLGAHLDNWGPGAWDSGSSLAMLLEFARLFSEAKGEIGRTIKFGCWGSHEYGTKGSWNYVFESHRREMENRVVAYFNVGHSPVRGKGPSSKYAGFTEDMKIYVSPEMDPVIQDVAKKMGLKYQRDFPLFDSDDHTPFFIFGVPSLQFVHAEIPYIYHTTGLDTFRNIIVDGDLLKQLAFLVGKSALRMANSPVLPLNFVGWTDVIEKELTSLETESKDYADFPKMLEAVRAFRIGSDKLVQKADAFNTAYAQGTNSELESTRKRASSGMIKIGRVLLSTVFDPMDLMRGRQRTEAYIYRSSVLTRIALPLLDAKKGKTAAKRVVKKQSLAFIKGITQCSKLAQNVSALLEKTR
jgi:hypothetical protein